MHGADFLRSSAPTNSGPIDASPTMLQRDSRVDSATSNRSSRKTRSESVAIPEEKPIASGNGVSVSVHLTEPVLFLQGFDHHDTSTGSTAMLRGNLHLKVAKSAKIKAVTLRFRGTAVTKWPEGIPPKKIDVDEVNNLMSHTWPFFNAQFATSNTDGGSRADIVHLANGQTSDDCADATFPYMSGSPFSSTLNLNSRETKRLSIQANHSRSFDKDCAKTGPTVAQRGYRTFYPGDYIYNFELPLSSLLPETIDVELGYVKYELEATVERAGAFKTNLFGVKEVTLIRAPSEGSLEQVEPIAISRNWEDQLHYDIVISGKSFPLGAKVPIAFKLTPLAKVQCHRIKVFVTENIEYFCSSKRVHRMEPTRKVLLFEKRADGPSSSTFSGSTMRVTAGGGIPFDQRAAAASGEEVPLEDTGNLLGHLEAESNVGPTEMEFSVQLPSCHPLSEKDKMNRLHFDTTYANIQVHHWIKIVMRLSKPDAVDPTKRRHFEISIDSPFHILSCRASQANTALPAYSSPDPAAIASDVADCGCPGALFHRVSPKSFVPTLSSFNSQGLPTASATLTGENSSAVGHVHARLARPQQAHLHLYTGNDTASRPMHMLRAPSFNPPAFEDDYPPPPLVTPPPDYGDIASPSHGLADYFSRLANTYDEGSDDEAVHSPGRVRVPLTPGSRINRSMDIPRDWVPVGL